MKIGLFGGSFNPPHNGHKKALASFSKYVDTTLVIPSFISPHKETPHLTPSFEHRFEMARIAFSDIDGVEISDIEKRLYLKNHEKSYTKNTLEALIEENDAEFHLFVGTDMFVTLHEWRESEWIFKNATIDVMSRDGDIEIIEKFCDKFEKDYGARINVIKEEHITLSSTDVRNELLCGSASDLIDEGVAKYIEENRLYLPLPERKALLEYIEKRLSKNRFSHTLSVEKEALALARGISGVDKNALSACALLHDVTKHLTFDEHIDILEKYSHPITEEDRLSPATLHSLTGSLVAKNEFSLPPDIVNAIRYHTTGRADMTLLEVILFVADYTEETRSHLSCQKERVLLHTELDCAKSETEKRSALFHSTSRILKSTVEHLKEKTVFIHPLTLEALDFFDTEE